MAKSRGLDRRDFISVAAAGLAVAGTPARTSAATQPAETASSITPQPMPEFGDDQNTADILVEILIA